MAKYKHMDLEETLGNLYPDLANEWCFERNEALTPFKVIPGSAKQVWWKCSKCQYQWQAAVYARVKGQKSCMHCKSLAANYPDLTEELCYKLNGEKSPFDVYPGSINSVWWECKDCHHRWQASIGHRVKGLKGCSNCKTLAIVNPSLAQEWCYELNKGLTPNDVTTKTSREVWWKCKDCNNRWKARIVARTDGLDCQVCKKRNLSLGIVDPDLSKEWCQELNGELTPYDIHAGTTKKVWWKCLSCHNQWKASVEQRRRGNEKCARCKSIATTHPEIVAEWHPTKNGKLTSWDVTYGSQRKIWWQCSKKPSHVWQATISSRTTGGNGCRYCGAGKSTSVIELTFYLALKEVFSDTLNGEKITPEKKEADIFIPSLKLAIEYDGGFYHSSTESKINDEKKNKAFASQGISLIRIRDYKTIEVEPYGCDIITYHYEKTDGLLNCWHELINCLEHHNQGRSDILKKLKRARAISIENKRIEAAKFITEVPKEESLGFLFPEVAAEWYDEKNGFLSPFDVYPFSHEKYWWKCSSNPDHIWQASVAHRSNGTKCRVCHGRGSAKVVTFENSIAGMYPEIAKEWHLTRNGELTPDQVAGRSNEKFWWQCLKDPRHVWETTPDHRAVGRNCHYCSGQKFLPEDSLAANCPSLMEEWFHEKNRDLDPWEIGTGYTKKVWWKCKKDSRHIWDAVVYSRTAKNPKGCPYCAKKRVLKEESLAAIYPEIASQWDEENNLSPWEVLPTSSREVWWKCKEGHRFKKKIIRKKVDDCQKCYDKF